MVLFYAYSILFCPVKRMIVLTLPPKYGYRLSDSTDFYLTGLFNAKSQFTKGYNYDAPEWDTFPLPNSCHRYT